MLRNIGTLSMMGFVAVKGTKIRAYETKKAADAVEEKSFVAKDESEIKVEATKFETIQVA